MTAGELNDVLVLGTTVCVLVGGWLKWGRKWLKQRTVEREAIVYAAMKAPKMEKALEELRTDKTRITQEIATVKSGIDLLADELRKNSDETRVIRATMMARANADTSMGYFESSVTGGNLVVNETYRRNMKCGTEDLLGWRFLNFVHPDDREMVSAEWELCREQCREYRMDHRLKATDGTVWHVHTRADPIPPGQEPTGWIGFITFLRMEPAVSGVTE